MAFSSCTDLIVAPASVDVAVASDSSYFTFVDRDMLAAIDDQPKGSPNFSRFDMPWKPGYAPADPLFIRAARSNCLRTLCMAFEAMSDSSLDTSPEFQAVVNEAYRTAVLLRHAFVSSSIRARYRDRAWFLDRA